MISIGGVEIGGDNPCRFIFEVSNAHNGSLDRAHRLIDAAKACGADLVKFQAYTPDELVALRGNGPAPAQWGAQGWTMRSLYEKAQTPLAWLPELFQHARDIELPAFSSVFGLESLAALEKCACPAYKIARIDNHHDALIEAVHSRGKPMLVSAFREPFADKIFNSSRWHPDDGVLALWCPPGYPSEPATARLPFFGWQMYGKGELYIGLSSHCLDPLLPIAAVSRGCMVIEMHGQLDDEPSELEANVSLTTPQFQQMIRDVRRVEAMLG